MLFSGGALRFHFKPDQRVSVGFRSNRSMIELKQCIFRRSGKKTILGILGTEYAPDRENAAKIPMGDYDFCRLSDAQNDQNLDFFAFFVSFEIQLHQTQNGQIPTETRSCGPF